MSDYEPFDIENGKTSDFIERLGFVRKVLQFKKYQKYKQVYAILSFQLAITTMFCILSVASASFALFQIQNMALFYICLLLAFITQIFIICSKKAARKVPNNYIALGVFTFAESWMVSTFVGLANLQFLNGGQLVLIAAVLTLGITLSLTYYAFTTKSDFTLQGGALFIFGAVILLVGIINFFVASKLLHILYVSALAILFGFYLIYDTQLIIGGKSHELDVDDYIIGALIIYIDIIQIFLQILQLLLELFGKKD